MLIYSVLHVNCFYSYLCFVIVYNYEVLHFIVLMLSAFSNFQSDVHDYVSGKQDKILCHNAIACRYFFVSALAAFCFCGKNVRVVTRMKMFNNTY